MKFLHSFAGMLIIVALSACSGGDKAAPAPTRLLAEVTSTTTGPSVFKFTRAQYTIAKTTGGFVVTDNMGSEAPVTVPDGARLRFADMSVALDIDGMAGKAYRIYKA